VLNTASNCRLAFWFRQGDERRCVCGKHFEKFVKNRLECSSLPCFREEIWQQKKSVVLALLRSVSKLVTERSKSKKDKYADNSDTMDYKCRLGEAESVVLLVYGKFSLLDCCDSLYRQRTISRGRCTRLRRQEMHIATSERRSWFVLYRCHALSTLCRRLFADASALSAC